MLTTHLPCHIQQPDFDSSYLICSFLSFNTPCLYFVNDFGTKIGNNKIKINNILHNLC